ncbi:hypothetical protein B0H14DRAFT_3148022 [Mycena olivaceomarginata]|nr:hypothetical protein B0H14DRAFT_3148022 [Mycena olivaceomarginata]
MTVRCVGPRPLGFPEDMEIVGHYMGNCPHPGSNFPEESEMAMFPTLLRVAWRVFTCSWSVPVKKNRVTGPPDTLFHWLVNAMTSKPPRLPTVEEKGLLDAGREISSVLRKVVPRRGAIDTKRRTRTAYRLTIFRQSPTQAKWLTTSVKEAEVRIDFELIPRHQTERRFGTDYIKPEFKLLRTDSVILKKGIPSQKATCARFIPMFLGMRKTRHFMVIHWPKAGLGIQVVMKARDLCALEDDAGDEKNIGKILSACQALPRPRVTRFLATPNLRRFVAVRDTDFACHVALKAEAPLSNFQSPHSTSMRFSLVAVALLPVLSVYAGPAPVTQRADASSDSASATSSAVGSNLSSAASAIVSGASVAASAVSSVKNVITSDAVSGFKDATSAVGSVAGDVTSAAAGAFGTATSDIASVFGDATSAVGGLFGAGVRTQSSALSLLVGVAVTAAIML